jgi:pilus assembly protein TadC
MKPEDDQLFEVTKPEPFLAFIAGGLSGYLSALLMVLLVFPALDLTNWQGHGFVLLSVLVMAFGVAAVEALSELAWRKRK